MTMDEIVKFMGAQFDPLRFIFKDRYRFWSRLKQKPGETIHEFASRIRQDAMTCDFQLIKD